MHQTQNLHKTLNILKGGLYSTDEEVAINCIQMFQALVIDLNSSGGDLVGQTWDWLVKENPEDLIDETASVQQKRISLPNARQENRFKQPSQNKVVLSALNNKSPRQGSLSSKTSKKKQNDQAEGNEFLETLKQSGLRGLLHVFKTLEASQENVSLLLLNFGKFNSQELFTEKVPQMLGQYSESATFNQIVFQATFKSQIGLEVLLQTDVLTYWVQQSLKVVESPIDVTLDDRISSLIFLTEIWINCTAYFDSQIQGSGQATLNILKRAARDIKQTLSTVAIELMFRLLDHFAVTKNLMAPTIYKTLTFILIEFYWEIDVRELMLSHFVQLFKRVNTIPVAILCEPLLKQVEISQYHATSFNIFDFEFFQVVAYHRKLNTQTAMLLMEALTKISLSSIFFSRVALQTLKPLIMRFSKKPELLAHWKESFREMLQSLISTETTLVQHEIAAKEEKKDFYSRLAQQTRGRRYTKTIHGRHISEDFRLTDAEAISVKTNQRLLVNVLEKIIELGNDLLNEELRHQLIDSFVACQQQLQVKSKPITYLLAKYGVNVDQMISHSIQKIVPPSEPEDQYAQTIQQSPSFILEEDALKAQNQVSPQQPAKSRSVSKSPIRNELGQKLVENPVERQIETAQAIQKSVKKSSSQPRIAQLRANRFSVKNSIQHTQETNTPHSVSAARTGSLELYRYDEIESATNVLRYRHLIKQNMKLYKDIFARYDGNKSKNSRVPKSMRTFETAKQLNQVISSTNLLRMVKELDLMPNQGNFLTALRIRQDIPALIKLINQLPGLGVTSKLPELGFNGFVEFLVQYSHQLWNISSITGSSKHFLAVELSEKLLEHIQQVNEQKRLMIPQRFFNGNNKLTGPTANREQQEIIALLNEKVAIDPEYSIPDGYKKVQDWVIEEAQVTPDDLQMNQSEKIVFEVLDEILSNAVPDLHIFQSIPVKKKVTRVVVDQNKVLAQIASRKLRSVSVASQLSTNNRSPRQLGRLVAPSTIDTQSRKSLKTSKARSVSISPNNRLRQKKSVMTPQVVSGKINLLNDSFKRQSQLRPELKLAVMNAPAFDQQHLTEVAHALEDILQAVEVDKIQGFSLQENERKSNMLRNSKNYHLSQPQLSIDEVTGAPQPRYQQKYVSRKTRQRMKEMEEEKKALEKPISSAERRERAKIVRESLARQAQYIEQQKKQRQEQLEQEKKQKQLEQETQARARRVREAQNQKQKAQLKEYVEKRDKEKKEQEEQKNEERKQKQRVAKSAMRENQNRVALELKQLRENTVKANKDKQNQNNRQGALPRLRSRPSHNYQSREEPVQGDSSRLQAARKGKPPIPNPSVNTKRSTNASRAQSTLTISNKDPSQQPTGQQQQKSSSKEIPGQKNSALESIETLNSNNINQDLHQQLPPRHDGSTIKVESNSKSDRSTPLIKGGKIQQASRNPDASPSELGAKSIESIKSISQKRPGQVAAASADHGAGVEAGRQKNAEEAKLQQPQSPVKQSQNVPAQADTSQKQEVSQKEGSLAKEPNQAPVGTEDYGSYYEEDDEY